MNTPKLPPEDISAFVSDTHPSLTCVIFEDTPVIIQDAAITPAVLPPQLSREPNFQTIPITRTPTDDRNDYTLKAMTERGQENQRFRDLDEFEFILEEHVQYREQNLIERLTQPSLNGLGIARFQETYDSRYDFYQELANTDCVEDWTNTSFHSSKSIRDFLERFMNLSYTRAHESTWDEQPCTVTAVCPECDHPATHIFRPTQRFKPQKHNPQSLSHLIHCPTCNATDFPNTHISDPTPAFTTTELTPSEKLYSTISQPQPQ